MIVVLLVAYMLPLVYLCGTALWRRQAYSSTPGANHNVDDSPQGGASWLLSTEWHWNGWRNIKFHAPRRGREEAKFWAPTADCEEGLCTWRVDQQGRIRIRWGDAGWHTLHAVNSARLRGVRDEDGEPCEAALVGHFAETLLDLDLYSILEVPSDSDAAALRRAFRRLSLDAHPDKRGSQDDFITLRGAYEILSDPEQRAKYDAQAGASAALADVSRASLVPARLSPLASSPLAARLSPLTPRRSPLTPRRSPLAPHASPLPPPPPPERPSYGSPTHRPVRRTSASRPTRSTGWFGRRRRSGRTRQAATSLLKRGSSCSRCRPRRRANHATG